MMAENGRETPESTERTGSSRKWLYGLLAAVVLLAVVLVITRVLSPPEPLGPPDRGDVLSPDAGAPGPLQFVVNEESRTVGPWFPTAAETSEVAEEFIATSVEEARANPWPPLPTDTGRTAEERQQEQREWMQRFLVSSYEDAGTHDPAWNELAKEFLAAAATRVMLDPDDREYLQRLVAQAERLEELNCTDPLVIYWQGNVIDNMQGAAAAEPYLRRALEQLQESTYPRLTVFYAARRLMMALIRQQEFESEQVQNLRDLMFRTFGAAAGHPMISEPSGRDIYAQEVGFLLGQMQPRVQDLDLTAEAIQQVETPDPWAYALVMQHYHLTKAWVARESAGPPAAAGESPEAFEEELRQAYDVALAGWREVSDRPELARALLEICRAMGRRDELREWFRRAVETQFDYLPAYDSMLLSLTPQSGGTLSNLLSFADAAAATERYDTWIPFYAIRSLHQGSRGFGANWRDLWQHPDLESLALGVCAGYREAGNEAPLGQQPQQPSLEMAVTWAGGEYSRARELQQRLGVERDLQIMENIMPNIRLDVLRTEAAIGSGAYGSDQQEILKLVDAGAHGEALTQLAKPSALTSFEEAAGLVHLIDRATAAPLNPKQESSRIMMTLLQKMLRHEAVMLRYGKALHQHGIEALGDLGATARAVIGPEALVFINHLPPVGSIGRRDLQNALTAIDDAAQTYREEKELQPGSAEDRLLNTHQALARLRWLLQADVTLERRALEQYVGGIIGGELRRATHVGLVLDFLQEWLRQGWIDGVLANHVAQMVHAALVSPADQDEEMPRADLEQLTAALEAGTYSKDHLRRLVATSGSPHICLLISTALREHEEFFDAAVVDEFVRDWMWRFYQATRSLQVWSPWQCMMVFNRVEGQELEVLFYGQKAIAFNALSSTSYMTASACIRLDWMEGAVWYLLRGRELPDDVEQFVGPDGVYYGKSNYVIHLLEQILRRKQASEANLDALQSAFPSEYAEAQATVAADETNP